jgi:hypothetical protein
MSEPQIPTYGEALRMLAAKAKEGSVTAIVALERALRTHYTNETDQVGEAIDRILAKRGSSGPAAYLVLARCTSRIYVAKKLAQS